MTDPRYPIGRFTPPAVYTAELRRTSIDQIAEFPALLRQSVAGLDADQRRTPYREGGWTIAQVVHHLADSHMNAYIRIKLALTEADPTIKPYDEKRWAELPDGSDPEIDASLWLLAALHERWSAAARRFTAADFERTLVHPDRGPMTVDRCQALYAWHGRHHVAHIITLREQKGW